MLMLIRILSWNVRGINDKDKRKVVKAFLRLQKADLVCLQETKCKLMSDSVLRSLGFGRFVNWGSVHSRGQAGGILVSGIAECWSFLRWKQGSIPYHVGSKIVMTISFGFLPVFMG